VVRGNTDISPSRIYRLSLLTLIVRIFPLHVLNNDLYGVAEVYKDCVFEADGSAIADEALQVRRYEQLPSEDDDEGTDVCLYQRIYSSR